MSKSRAKQSLWAFFKARLRRFFTHFKLLFTTDPGPQAEALVDAEFSTSLVNSALVLKGAVAKAAQLLGYKVPRPEPSFSVLFDKISGDSPQNIRKIFLEEFQKTPEQIFENWQGTAVAAASIGEVHRATHQKHGDLAVKVQYLGMAEYLKEELTEPEILQQLAGPHFKESLSTESQKLLRSVLLQEIDYLQEATWLQRFKKGFRKNPQILIPTVYPDLSSKRILTMEYIHGQSFLTFCQSANNDQRDKIAKYLFEFAYGSVVKQGLLNADPNPGNFLVTVEGRLAALDFGCCWDLPNDVMQYEQVFWQSLLAEDAEMLRYTLYRAGFIQEASIFDSTLYREYERLLRLPFATTHFLWDENYAQLLLKQNHLLLSDKRFSIPTSHLLIWRQRLGFASVLAMLRSEINFRELLQATLK